MYSVVLATVLTAGAVAPDLGWRGHGGHGCYGAAYGGCYGVGYGGWAGPHSGGYPGYGSWSCLGGASCYGCWGCYGCYGCTGCWGCTGNGGTWSCTGGSGNGHGYGGAYGSHEGMGMSHGEMTHGAMPITGTPSNGETLPNPMTEPSGNSQITNNKPATVVIRATKDVKIKVNGQLTSRNQEEETFRTPELRVGRSYSYEVVAEVVREGKTVTATKRVLVHAGEQSAVDFSDMSGAVASTTSESAQVTVLLPEDGTLYVGGEAYPSKAKQTFNTPKLEKGKTYAYTLEMRAKSSNNTVQQRKVMVEAGREVTVDFRTVGVAAR